MDKFTVMPQSINHNESPAFVANWFSGDEVQENREEDSFYYEADGGLGQLLICRIKWQDEKPQLEEYNQSCISTALGGGLGKWLCRLCY